MTRLRYAGAPPRYARARARYATPGFRYADGPPRYAATRVRYAGARLRYAGAAFRYAAASVRYAVARFRYAAAGFGVKDAGWAADSTGMTRPAPAMSNVERQRLFRLRHPGYYARVNARRRAGHKAAVRQSLAAAQALAVRREPLLLPAPVKLLEIPGINAHPGGDAGAPGRPCGVNHAKADLAPFADLRFRSLKRALRANRRHTPRRVRR